MSSRYKEAYGKNLLIGSPKWISDNIQYEVMTGSVAYGASSDTSDMDIVGFAIPPKSDLFPYNVGGHILGFGKKPEPFEQYQKHHVFDSSKSQEYDFTIYNIVKFFDLCMENNPNMIDTLFVPQRCVLHCTKIAQHVRDNRKEFLHKGSFKKFRGYAYSQLDKIGTKANSENPKRQKSIEEFGYDVKFAYHVVRLALEAEQILQTQDLDLECNSEILKSIRRGEWPLESFKEWFQKKSVALEEVYSKSTLRQDPDEEKIKKILLECIEMHYGSVSEKLVMQNNDQIISDLIVLLNKYGYDIK